MYLHILYYISEKICLFFVKFECFGTSETRSHFSPTIGKILHRQDWDSDSSEKINPRLIYPMIWPGFLFLAIGKHKPLAGLALKESFNDWEYPWGKAGVLRISETFWKKF